MLNINTKAIVGGMGRLRGLGQVELVRLVGGMKM